MKRILVYILALLAPVCAQTAMASAKGNVSHSDHEFRLSGDKLEVSMMFNLDSLKLGRERQLYLTPVITGPDGAFRPLPSLLVNGRYMHIAYQRGALRKDEVKRHNIYKEVQRANGKPQSVEYRVTVPREGWMLSPQASIAVVTDTCGCGVLTGSNPGSPVPLELNPVKKMLLPFMTPLVTEQPVTVHEGKARVQFEVDKTVLHDEPYVCKSGQRIDNRPQLRMIDDSVRYALTDPNVELAAIAVCGYASPESPYSHNEYLSTGRSRALAEYLGRKYNLPAEQSTYTSVPENWGEFREIVDTTKLLTPEQRADLLELIDRPTYGPSDFDQKERELKTSPKFAKLYRSLILPVWFPRLRATTFAIKTRLKPMSDEKLAEVMQKTPALLSLNQMMRVARLYPEGSEKFNKAISTALEYYPNDETANLNAAVAALRAEDYKTAEQLLQKAGNSPQAQNARGVLEVQKGDFKAAKDLFESASPLPEALRNIELIK